MKERPYNLKTFCEDVWNNERAARDVAFPLIFAALLFLALSLITS